MQETILIVYLVVAIALIGIILLQQGKGAEMGASFGAGGANTVFGAAGSGNVLTKSTTILAILFFAIALSISYLNSEPTVAVDAVIDETVEQPQQAVSLDAEVPQTDAGLASEIAPTQQLDAAASEVAPELKTEEIEPTDPAVKAVEDGKDSDANEDESDNN